jgi:hypothetical protein
MSQSSRHTADERRQFRRSIVGMPVQAVRRQTPQDDPRRLIGLHVMNVSRGGVGAITQQPMDVQEPVLLFFPPLGPGRGRDMTGEVVRCDACEGHFALGIRFEEPWPEHEEIRA